MKNKIQTYDGKITEFVDWVSGQDVITGLTATGNLPVGGGSIRELVQNKLLHPIYLYEDKLNARYRIFSSKESFELWKSDPETYSNLQESTFIAPTEFDFKITGLSGNRKYMRYGDTTAAARYIEYEWEIVNSTGNSYDDSVTVTYEITNNKYGSRKFATIYNSSRKHVSEDIFQYLASGTNNIKISMKSANTSAQYSIGYIIEVIELNISSDFSYHVGKATDSETSVVTTLTRNNTNYGGMVCFYLDGEKKYEYAINIGGEAVSVIGYNFINQTDSSEQHVFEIHAYVNVDGNKFWSNLLYYTFNTTKSVAASNKYINIFSNIASQIECYNKAIVLNAVLYEDFTLDWSYYTDLINSGLSTNVNWVLKTVTDETETVLNLATILGNKDTVSKPLSFRPNENTKAGQEMYVVAQADGKELVKFPIFVQKSSLLIYETSNYSLKLSAYGKNNSGSDRSNWTFNNISTEFSSGVVWSNTNGWYNNSLRLTNENATATINYNPFNSQISDPNRAGRTIEIEFEPEVVNNENDVLATIGDLNRAHIIIRPTLATFYSNATTEVVHTNYKANERIKLCFVVYGATADPNFSGLVTIINNGILERANSFGGIELGSEIGNIVLGGSLTGVKIYNIRCYNYSISTLDAYNNFVYDSDKKSQIVSNNNILVNNEINQELTLSKIDVIVISGNLQDLLDKDTDKEQSNTSCTIERICNYDTTKNFKITNARIRKHGQSTLNYPVPSFKIWANSPIAGTSELEWEKSEEFGFSKNRYTMKDGSIPSNKWVLQANYADSSGVHNGGFERLLHESWYNAKIDNEYKLRTAPLLFSTNEHISTFGDEKIIANGYNESKKQWSDYFKYDFPYDIRVSPDSFPCVVFYKNTDDELSTFLGQYVMMDDKKADFIYGERSIYNADRLDPFCLKIQNKTEDSDENRIWSNDNVCRIEVLNINNLFVSYMNGKALTTLPVNVYTDGVFDSALSHSTTKEMEFDEIVYSNYNDDGTPAKDATPIQFRWEQDFELIYPDPDDLQEGKFQLNSKFQRKTQNFVNWFKNIVRICSDQSLFEQEATKYLDIYKLAAYYIFFLRFGLVDSVERNAQLKTYDGIHWHYEPWDMDIALGNKNTGGIVFNPPINRLSVLPDATELTYAYSGKSITTSNRLWDCLEKWTKWSSEIVPKVASALYDATDKHGNRCGLTYDNIIKMLDGEYSEKWCENIYNNSGIYKYIKSRNGDNSWLEWLQGSRTTHRHWWLKTSMDYWDAYWGMGDFINHSIYIAANHVLGLTANLHVKSYTNAFLKFTLNYDEQNLGTYPIETGKDLILNITNYAISTKTPFLIYGANFISELNLSEISNGIDILRLTGCYSKDLGTNLKSLNIGVPITKINNDKYTGKLNGLALSLSTFTDSGDDVLTSLETLNIRGQYKFTNLYDLLNNTHRSALKNVYAMGSGAISFSSSIDGNDFETLELPDTVANINLTDSSWKNISFWHTTPGEEITDFELDDQGNPTDNVIVVGYEDSTFEKVIGIPKTLDSVKFMGSTGSQEFSKEFILDWIDSIEANGQMIESKTFEADSIRWEDITYAQLEKIAKFNNGNNANGKHLKGHIILEYEGAGTELTSTQLSNIRQWFGDGVFNRGNIGSNLVIGYRLDYVLISVGNEAYTIGNQIHLNEGSMALILATRFNAQDDTEKCNWFLGAASTNSSEVIRYKSCVIYTNEDTGDVYLKADESENAEYDVKLYCSYNSGGSGVVLVHINTATYGQFKWATKNSDIKIDGNNFTFPKDGVASEFYITNDDEHTATIKSVKFSIINNEGVTILDNVPYTEFKGNSNNVHNISNDQYLVYNTKTVEKYSINLMQVGHEFDPLYYTLRATMNVGSRVNYIVDCTLILMDDEVVISNLTSDLARWFNSIYKLYTGIDRNETYYKSTMLVFNDTVDIAGFENIASLVTAQGRSVLKYLSNAKSVILDNATNITDVDINEFANIDLTGMPNLETLSMRNCTGITRLDDVNALINLKRLDVSGCGDSLQSHIVTSNTIEYIDTRDTNVSVTAISNALTEVHFGSPSVVHLEDSTISRTSFYSIDLYGYVCEYILKNNATMKNGFAILDNIINEQWYEYIEEPEED